MHNGGTAALGVSLLNETEEAVDSAEDTVSSLPAGADGQIRGVRVGKVVGHRVAVKNGQRRSSLSPLSSDQPVPPPLAPVGPLNWVRGACLNCKRKLRSNGNPGENICERCLADILPFNHSTNDRQFREALMGFFGNYRHLDKASQLIFNP